MLKYLLLLLTVSSMNNIEFLGGHPSVLMKVWNGEISVKHAISIQKCIDTTNNINECNK